MASTQWSAKDPDDTADYWFDWDTFLPAGESITNAVVTSSDAALHMDDSDFTDRTVRARLSGGVVSATYQIGCTITTDTGQIFDVTKSLSVAERVK